jgi:hypothetical protein
MLKLPRERGWPEGSIAIQAAPPCWGRSRPNLTAAEGSQLPASENNSSDHPVGSGKPTSPHDFN